MRGKPILLALGLVWCSALPLPALAADAPVSDREVEALWTRHWREFAAHYVAFDGGFVQFPAMERGAANSSGIDAREYEKTNTHEMTYDDERGREKTQVLRKPKAETAAATRVLPALEPGAFGEVHSGKVAAVVDDATVRLTEVWLIDPDAVAEDREADREALRKEFWGDVEESIQRGWGGRSRIAGGGGGGGGGGFGGGGGDGLGGGGGGRSRIADKTFELRDAVDWRFEQRDKVLELQRRNAGITLVLHGFKTSPMAQSQRWPSRGGVGIAVVRTQAREGFAGPEVHAIPLATARKGASETEFAAMLADRGLSRRDFVTLVQEARKINLRDYKPLVLPAIENGGKLATARAADGDVEAEQPAGGGDVILAE